MHSLSRRSFFALSAGAAAVVTTDSAPIAATPARTAGLTSLIRNVAPITPQERAARVAKVQSLMQKQKVAALLIEAGSTLDYFTGVQWWRSERTTAALIPARGSLAIVTPFFEEPSIREMLQVAGDVRTWKEDESPFALLASLIRERAGDGPLAMEPTTRFFIVDNLRKASASGRDVVPGDDLVRACRLIKSPAELALMQAANEVTLGAIRHVHQHVQAGMTAEEILKMHAEATVALGGKHEDALVLLNEASAFPHGSNKPQSVRTGSVILIDAVGSLHGYASDVTRTWVFSAEPTARQREVWATVKRGQEIALETAKLGAPVGAIDKAVRAFYEGKGWSKDYGLPGTSHRTGHGIGMDVHEPAYLVRSDNTPLEAGMCFSDEPGIYIPGEFGVRLEDCWYMTEAGPKLFTPLAASIDRPI
jgi:Xaa-Pro dipeptidase